MDNEQRTHQRLASVESFTVKAEDTILSRVYQFKYFGIVLEPYLSWNDHTDYIGHKISARLSMLRKAHKVISRELCISLYKAMILTIFDYSAVIWDCCSKTNRDYLDKLSTETAASIIKGYSISQSLVHHTFSLFKMHASFQVHTWLSTTYLLNEFRTCNTETCSTCPWQEHPSTRDCLGTALPLDPRDVHDMSLFKSGLKEHFGC